MSLGLDVAVLPTMARTGPRRAARIASVAVPTALVGWHALLYGRWIADDAGVALAYARSLATGAGPVLQPGADPVEGYPSPAWLALLTAARWLGLLERGTWFGVPDYVAFPKLLALLLVAGVFSCVLLVATAVTRHPELVTAVAGTLTAAVPSFVIWTVSGLENSLLALAVAGIAAVLARAAAADRLLATSTAVGCGLLAALAALTRPDGLVYAAAFPVAALVLLRSAGVARAAAMSGVALAAFAAPVGAYLGLRVATFGQLLPAVGAGWSGPAAARPAELLGYAGWPLGLLAAVAVAVTAAQPWAGRPGFVALLVPPTVALAALALLEPGPELRCGTPVWPLAVLAVVIAAQHVVPQLTVRGRAIVGVLAAVATLVCVTALVEAAQAFRAAPATPLCEVAQTTARSFDTYAQIVGARGASLLTPDVGGVALAGDLRIVDPAGRTDRRLAELRAADDVPGVRDHVFLDARPTFITGSDPDLGADRRLATDYAAITTSAAGVTDWVRRDALAPGPAGDATLAALRGYGVRAAGPAAVEALRSPRASCGDVLVPPSG